MILDPNQGLSFIVITWPAILSSTGQFDDIFSEDLFGLAGEHEVVDWPRPNNAKGGFTSWSPSSRKSCL